MLQEIIQQLEAKIEEQNQREVPTQLNHAARIGKILAYEHAIQIIRSKLPEFEEAIKKAFAKGETNCLQDTLGNGGEYLSPQDYYNQTYKK